MLCVCLAYVHSTYIHSPCMQHATCVRPKYVNSLMNVCNKPIVGLAHKFFYMDAKL